MSLRGFGANHPISHMENYSPLKESGRLHALRPFEPFPRLYRCDGAHGEDVGPWGILTGQDIYKKATALFLDADTFPIKAERCIARQTSKRYDRAFLPSPLSTMEGSFSHVRALPAAEAPITLRAYLMCAFAAFGGIFFGYDSGYINGVMGMDTFIHDITGLPYPGSGTGATPKSQFAIPSSHQSLIVSILSAGTFIGAVLAGDIADWYGRRTTVIAGCVVFVIGVVLQTAASVLAVLVVGRLVAGFGVGFVSATIVLYMSEIAPKRIRGVVVSGYQFFITVGLLVASCINYGTKSIRSSASYRILIGF